MMNKYIVAALAIVAAMPVNAKNGNDYVRFGLVDALSPWVDANGGSTTLGSAFGLDLGYGRKFGAWRVEGDFTMRSKAKKNGYYAELTTLLANGYYDFDIKGSKWKPYLSAGLGWGSATDNSTSYHAIAMQLGFGTSYQFNQSWSGEFGYRWLDYTKNKSAKFGANELVAVAKYSF